MSENKPPPPFPSSGEAGHKYWSPKASLVSAFMTRWPNQPIALADIVVIGYAEETARLDDLEDQRRRTGAHSITAKAMGTMTRAAVQRYVEGDGFFLQEGRIHEVYDTAGPEPTRPHVWRATPMDHPAPAGPQTTDDWLIIWDAHKAVRSSPLLRESRFMSRIQPLAELFTHETDRMFSAGELLTRLYPKLVEQTARSAPSQPAAHQRIGEISSAMVRAVLYDQKAGELLSARLAEHDLQLLQGHVVKRLKGFESQEEGRARTLFRAVPLTATVPDEPVRHGHSMIRWQKLYGDSSRKD